MTVPNFMSKAFFYQRFITFWPKTLFCKARKILKSGFRVKTDFKKSRFKLLEKTNDHVKEIAAINFCYIDVNCCLTVKLHDVNQKDIFLATFGELHDTMYN